MKYFPPMPLSKARSMKLARDFAFIGFRMTRLRPKFVAEIAQAEIGMEAEYYCTLSLFSALFQGLVALAAISTVIYLVNRMDMLLLTVGLSLVVFVFVLFRNLAYPSMMIKRKVRELEKNFLYALRHILIEVKGGSPVFNAMVGVAEADYGNVSDEFRRVVKEIHSGESMETALEHMALRNPSIYLRRTVWQIVNALRTGSDMGVTLKVVVDQFAAEQRVILQKFGKELGPWAMMYMMVTVIFPTLGITLFLIVSSMSSVQLNEGILIGYLAISAVVQYFFLQMLKTKRPAMRW